MYIKVQELGKKVAEQIINHILDNVDRYAERSELFGSKLPEDDIIKDALENVLLDEGKDVSDEQFSSILIMMHQNPSVIDALEEAKIILETRKSDYDSWDLEINVTDKMRSVGLSQHDFI